jgi:MscS family membrane protein
MRQLLLAIAVSGLLPCAAAAQEPADCSTPRKAAITWLGNLQDDQDHPEIAVECFDWSGAGVSGRDRELYARRLKAVLDTRGLWVEMDELPDEADGDGADRVFLFEDELPDVFYVSRNGRWLMSGRSIRAVPTLYDETFDVDVESIVQDLPAWLRDRGLFGIAWWQIIGIFLALFLSLLARALVAWVISRWGARLITRAGAATESNVVAKAAWPIGTVVMAGILWWLLPLLRFDVRVNQIANVGIRVLAAVGAVMVLYRVVDVVSDVFERRADKTETKLDDQLIPLIRKSLKVFVVVVGVIFVLQNMDVDVTSLLAMGTVGTLAISFAAKDIIANLFGSVSIFAERPFQIGDWVTIGATEGVVEEVGMRSTRIRTFYNSVITVPNSVITVTPVDNYGVRQYRRTSVTVGLTYDTTPEQMEAFCDGVRAILAANPIVRKDYYEVHFKGFGASSLDVMLYFFFETGSWSDELRNRHLIFLEILRLARDLGVSFAFPTQTLHVESVAEAERRSPHEAPSDAELGATVLAFAPDGARARPDGPKISDGFYAGTLERGS